MTPVLTALPVSLQACRRALPWRRVSRANGGTGKVPLARRGPQLYPCDPRDPAHWLPWGEALAEVTSGHADGVGLWLDEALGVIGLDFDHCVQPGGQVKADVQAVLQVLGSDAYVETSPSGLGMHALVRGRLPAGWRRLTGTELITCGFLTVTGNAVQHAPEPWPVITSRLQAWHASHRPPPAPPPPFQRTSTPDDDRLLERAFRARSGPTFRALWHADPDATPSASEGDLRLLLMLLYWGGPDISDARLDAFFRASGRFRDKWDTQHGPITYGERTLAAARTIHSKRK